MALYSKKDFADMCGMPSKDLSKYRERGKVILSGEYYDDKVEQNASFLKKWSEKKAARELEKQEVHTEEKAAPPTPNISAPVVPPPRAPKVDKPTMEGSKYELDKKRSELTNEQMQLKIDMERVKLEKQMGQVIPTELVKSVIAQHSKSITVAFQIAGNDLIANMAKRKGFSGEEVAELRAVLTNAINKAVADSVNESKKTLKNIVAEYSAKRGVGERN